MMKKQLFSALLLLFTLITLVPAQKKQQKKDLKQAKEHLHFDEYRQAIPFLKNLLKTDPDNAHYNFWLGKSLYLTYKKNQALPYFERVSRVDPDIDSEFHYYYALTLHYNLKLPEAISEYELELARHQQGSEAYNEISKRIAQAKYAMKMLETGPDEKVSVTNMGENINTEYSEHSPVISGNDSILLITARRPESIGAKPEDHYYDEDIYISYKSGDSWSGVKNVGEPVNSKGHDATVSLTNDGKTLFLYRHIKNGGLYVTYFDSTGEGWRDPKPVGKPVNTKYYEANICMSSDSSRIYFSSNRPGGFGGLDIWYSEREGKDNWSEPKNMGPRINTPYDEDAPFIHQNNKTFYYSTNGTNSMGGYDILITELDTVSGEWLPPLNMGYPVNTPDDDIYFVISSSGKYGYYSSGKEGGFGEKDIYEIEFPYFPYPRRYPVIELTGLTFDASSNEAIPYTIVLVDAEEDIVLDTISTDTLYEFLLEGDKSYKFKVYSEGYLPYEETITTPRLVKDDIDLKKNFFLNLPVASTEDKPDKYEELAKTNKIRNIYFDFDKSGLRDDSRQQLEQVIYILNEYPELSIELSGHTDYYGSWNYNKNLSEKRVTSAYQYLLDRGIDSSRVTLTPESETRPIESNDSPEGRQFNRRVEFNFYKQDNLLFTSGKLIGNEEIKIDYTTPAGSGSLDGPDGNPAISESSVVNDLPDTPKEIEGFSFRNIYFAFDKSYLSGESKGELDKVFEFLQKNPQYELVIRGHTDSYGSVSYNQQLSETRAQNAYDYLIGKGIEPGRISSESFSELKPVKENTSNQGRQFNRRVEFVFLKNEKPAYKSRL